MTRKILKLVTKPRAYLSLKKAVPSCLAFGQYRATEQITSPPSAPPRLAFSHNCTPSRTCSCRSGGSIRRLVRLLLRDFASGGAQWHLASELNPVHLGFNVFRLKSGRELFLPERYPSLDSDRNQQRNAHKLPLRKINYDG